MNRAAQQLGRLGGKIGGRSKSPAKAAAARRNGRKGGRPKKGETTQMKNETEAGNAFLTAEK